MNSRYSSIGLLLLSALVGCSEPARQLPRTGLPDTGKPALHALSDAQLRELMARMNSLMFERFMTEPELDKERQRYALQMSNTAAQLSSAVDNILARMPALNLDDSELRTFRALAGKLRDEAKTLQQQADHRLINAIPATLDQITQTCSSCHELFRKLKS